MVVAGALVLGAAGCTDDAAKPSSERRATTPAPSSPPLSAYDGDDTQLVPRDPCAGILPDGVAQVLGADPASSLTWAPGQRLPGTGEVADEHGCRHTAGGVSAAA